MMDKLSIVIKSFLIICVSSCVLTSPIVTIKDGKLEGGIERSRKGREFAAFRGIPYALPPLGKLRFQPPQPANSWSDLRSAKEDSAACLQPQSFPGLYGKISEDCLYLNVYTPKIFKENEPEVTYPVMVWIHGGGWLTGSGHSALYSPKFLMDKNIVLVAMNYRLGPMGFLSTGDAVIRGNQGLKDQVLALRWVQENIAAFGGDPNSVTIFGQSAGSASTHFLMLSPLAKGLFHRVISQSGTARGSWVLRSPRKANKQAHLLGRAVNCTVNSSQELHDCLLEKDAATVAAVFQQWMVFGHDPMVPFRPVIEVDLPGAFLTGHPQKILESANLVDVPWMSGITSEEGLLRTSSLYGYDEGRQVEQLNSNFTTLAPISLLLDQSCPQEKLAEVSQKIRNHYVGDKPIDKATMRHVTHMYTDAFFAYNAYTSIKEHLANLGSPIYFYQFAYRGTNSFSTIFGGNQENNGVCHGDELLYLFPVHEVISPNIPLSDDDEKMINILTTLWYNFAKTGNPTPEITEELPVKWKPVRTNALEYLAIKNPRHIKMSQDLWKERMEFWQSLPCKVGVSIPPGKDESENEL